jgi:hypothetical protein
MRSGLISRAKNKFVPGGHGTYVVPLGLYRGLKLRLDLRSNFQLFTGLWELETHRYLYKWTDYEWAIDVGAGAGELCLFMLKHKPSIRRVFAVEPDDAEVRQMKLNFQLNPELDVTKTAIVERRVGTGEKPGELRLDELGLEPESMPGLIKIDVDGHEIDVLKGARKILQRPNIDLLIETHSTSLEDQSIELLQSFGFATEVIKNGWYRRLFPEQRPIEHNRWLWASNR